MDENEPQSSWTVEAVGRVYSTRTEAIDDDLAILFKRALQSHGAPAEDPAIALSVSSDDK